MKRMTGACLVMVMAGASGCGDSLRGSSTDKLTKDEASRGFVPLFDGKTMKGWRYDERYWEVKDGVIVGNTHPTGPEHNSCAIWKDPAMDFILRWEIKLVSGNSGVQFRSIGFPNYHMAGYQADAVSGGWGNLHEQDGRRRLVDGWTDKAEKVDKLDDWNDMEIYAKGNHIILKTNGVVTADYTETDPTGAKIGSIGLQLHRGDPMEVRFRNIRLKILE